MSNAILASVATADRIAPAKALEAVRTEVSRLSTIAQLLDAADDSRLGGQDIAELLRPSLDALVWLLDEVAHGVAGFEASHATCLVDTQNRVHACNARWLRLCGSPDGPVAAATPPQLAAAFGPDALRTLNAVLDEARGDHGPAFGEVVQGDARYAVEATTAETVGRTVLTFHSEQHLRKLIETLSAEPDRDAA